jgi:hypothetical protein
VLLGERAEVCHCHDCTVIRARVPQERDASKGSWGCWGCA